MPLISEFEGVLIPFVEEIRYNLIFCEYKRVSMPPTIKVIIELWFFFLLQTHVRMGYPPLASKSPPNHAHQCIQPKGCLVEMLHDVVL
jgi:hypothetical protein